MRNDSCSFNLETIANCAQEFGIPETDVIMIAINRYGICANVPDKRLRFKFRPIDSPYVFYMAVCINTFESPFSLQGNEIKIGGATVGTVFDIEKDTCDATYFRRNRTELTLNSNMRSQCAGCTFCGTYNMDPEDKVDMSDDNKMTLFVEEYLEKNKVNDLSDLVRVTVCTGCFENELALVDHLISVQRVFSKFGFTKRIRYIGSQIQSTQAMDSIQRSIPNFSLSLTVECFSDRTTRMRKEKASLDMAAIQKVLTKSIMHQFSTNYLYIVGLDPLEIMHNGIKQLSPYVNRMPIFQIMQNYQVQHEKQRTVEALDFRYYLRARQIIESVFSGCGVQPRSWENYRGLFYTTYQDKPLQGIRI